MTFSNRQSRSAPTHSGAESGEGVSPFDALFQLHWNRVCGVLYRLVGDWDEAQDLALEAFWRLHQQPPANDGNLPGWLYRVATNLGYNALRAKKRRRQYEEQAGSLREAIDHPADPAQEVEQAQERERVRQALGSMKLRSAQLLALRYSGHSYIEISQTLEIAPASVGSLLARAEREFEQQYRKASRPEGTGPG